MGLGRVRRSYTKKGPAPFRLPCLSWGVKMKLSRTILILLASSSMAPAQTASGRPPDSASNTPAQSQPATPSPPALQAELDRLQKFAPDAAQVVTDLHIDRWKTNPVSRSAAQANADAIYRNLTAALPHLVEAARAAPDDVGAEFRVYRSVVALYEVLGALTDASRLSGQRSQYDQLSALLETLKSIRRNLGNDLEELTASAQTQLNQLRGEVKDQQQQLAGAQKAAAEAQQQVLLAEAELAKKNAPKKKTAAKKPAATASSSSANSASSNTSAQTSSAAGTPKQ